jgi:hypothetical protein
MARTLLAFCSGVSYAAQDAIHLLSEHGNLCLSQCNVLLLSLVSSLQIINLFLRNLDSRHGDVVHLRFDKCIVTCLLVQMGSIFRQNNPVKVLALAKQFVELLIVQNEGLVLGSLVNSVVKRQVPEVSVNISVVNLCGTLPYWGLGQCYPNHHLSYAHRMQGSFQ